MTVAIEKESLDQSITHQLTLLEHGVEESADQMQTVAYWVFKVFNSNQDAESTLTDTDQLMTLRQTT